MVCITNDAEQALDVYPTGFHHVKEAFEWQQKHGSACRMSPLSFDSVNLSSKALMSVKLLRQVLNRDTIKLLQYIQDNHPGVFSGGDATGTIHILNMFLEFLNITSLHSHAPTQHQRLIAIRQELSMMMWYLDALWAHKDRWCPAGIVSVQELFIPPETLQALNVTIDGHTTHVQQVAKHIPEAHPRYRCTGIGHSQGCYFLIKNHTHSDTMAF